MHVIIERDKERRRFSAAVLKSVHLACRPCRNTSTGFRQASGGRSSSHTAHSSLQSVCMVACGQCKLMLTLLVPSKNFVFAVACTLLISVHRTGRPASERLQMGKSTSTQAVRGFLSVASQSKRLRPCKARHEEDLWRASWTLELFTLHNSHNESTSTS